MKRKHAKLRVTIALILFIIGLSLSISAFITQSFSIYQKLGIIPVILGFLIIKGE